MRRQLTEQDVRLVIPQNAKDFLVDKGFDQQYGARPLRRTIQNMVEDPLAEGLLQGKYRAGDLLEAEIVDGQLTLIVRERADVETPSLPEPTETEEPALPAGAGDGSTSGTTGESGL